MRAADLIAAQGKFDGFNAGASGAELDEFFTVATPSPPAAE
jgi:hypothetical protein